MAEFDIVIHGGRVIDGTGNPWFYADVVIFDPDRVADTATYDNPKQYPKGIPYVLVNGKVVIENGHHNRRAARKNSLWSRVCGKLKIQN